MEKKVEKHIPVKKFRKVFYWAAICTISPLFMQMLIYNTGWRSNLKSYHPESASIAWAIVLVVILPFWALLHFTLKKILEEEIRDMRVVIEDPGFRKLGFNIVGRLYKLPVKIFFLTMPISILFILPVGFMALRHLELEAAIFLILIPVLYYFPVYVIVYEEVTDSTVKLLPFIQVSVKRFKVIRPFARQLVVKTVLIILPFIALCHLVLFAPGESSGFLTGSLPLVTSVSLLFFVAATSMIYWAGRRCGKEFLRLTASISRVVDSSAEDRAPLMERGSPPLFSDLKKINSLTLKLLGKMIKMRRNQKDAIDTMVRHQRVKTLLLASMSHDLKSPLNSIIGFAELLLKEIEGQLNEGQREDIKIIHDAGEELLQMINNILDYSTMEAGSFEIHKEWTPSVELITNAVREGTDSVSGKEITITTEIQPGLPPVFVDPHRISQVIKQLISNAIKFMEKGKITVRAQVARGLNEEDDRYLRIDVIDTGVGINNSDIERIFDSFTHAGVAISRTRSGLGLGLSIAKSIVELHDGKVWVTSTPGKGSVFSLGIPMEHVG